MNFGRYSFQLNLCAAVPFQIEVFGHLTSEAVDSRKVMFSYLDTYTYISSPDFHDWLPRCLYTPTH
jgi:hypothetical protein